MVWLQHQSSFSSNNTELHNFHLAANTPRLGPGLILIILQSATLVKMLQSFLDIVATRDMITGWNNISTINGRKLV